MNKNNNGFVRTLSLPHPTLQNNTADIDRLTASLKTELETDQIDIDLDLLKEVPDLIRKWDYNVRCTLFKDRKRWLLTGITDPKDTKPITGLAVDLGSTRLAFRLLNLLTGEILAESSCDNPQISIASDILARIHFADQEGGLEKLNTLIIEGFNTTIAQLCQSCNIEPNDIYSIAVAGNTAMTHLFMGLSPRWIIREPYIPVVNSPGVVKASELGIKANLMARVLIFPNIGSYFGGDLIAGILYSGLHKKEDTAILVDVGTNAEVVLGNKHWLIACAGAAGPALEGGVSRMGMTAGPGVIEQIVIDPDTYQFDIKTIGDMPPKGICGSGLIDLAAQLFLSGMIDIRGKLTASTCGSRLKEKDGIKYLIVVPAEASGTGADLTISQIDLNSLISSKAAMYTILETITANVGMTPNEIKTFYVAGTFGCFIKPQSAIAIGMLPDLPIESYQPLGNSSLGGATMAITSPEHIDEIYTIRDKITYLELNVNQAFMNLFSAAKFFPHTDPSLFPSVKLPGK